LASDGQRDGEYCSNANLAGNGQSSAKRFRTPLGNRKSQACALDASGYNLRTAIEWVKNMRQVGIMDAPSAVVNPELDLTAAFIDPG
jgi:hypothetical protein